ncbi:MAG: EfeM/EfeO family lipoprotein [Polyangiaceae bacterium]
MVHRRLVRALPFVAFIGLAACSSSSSKGTTGGSDAGPMLTDAQYQANAVSGMHDTLLKDIDDLLTAANAVQAAAPSNLAGWSDDAQVTNMKNAWIQARAAYEHSEGAISPLFPDIDVSIDARYDDFLASLGPAGDTYLFDDQGVTGMHAMERILYATVTPQSVVTFESTLPGYVAASFPTTDQEASDFKNKLCTKLVSDVTDLQTQWTPTNINVAIAYQGLVSLMNEQREKVNKAASSEEESRYSQRTMVDLRDNLDGTKAVYAIFQPWIVSKTNSDKTKDGPTIDGLIQAGFTKLAAAYAQISGDAFPPVPATWSSENPSPSDLQTPFGQLYTNVQAAVDPTTNGSVVFEMNAAATVLGFPVFTQ